MATWRNLRFGMAAVLALAAGARGWAAEVVPEIQTAFSKATGLIEEKRYAEALPLLRELALKVPDGPGIFGNLALVALKLGDRQLELQARLRYLELRPGEPREMAAVVQVYQALGKLKERDAQRDRIFALWKALPPADKEKIKGYDRDEFDAGGLHFIVTEYFEPAAPVNRLYRFDAVDASRRIHYFFALDSGDSTTSAAKELGNIPKDGRIYSLDRYETKGQTQNHATFGLMTKLPDYDTVRAMVLEAVAGRLPALSSSSRPLPPAQPQPK
jgi:hypothetical protein